MSRRLLFWIVALTGALATAQSASPQPSRAWELLKRVGQHYANATSYHLEATEEETSSNELQRHWEKTIFNVTEAPNGKYRYEVGDRACAADFGREGVVELSLRRPLLHGSS